MIFKRTFVGKKVSNKERIHAVQLKKALESVVRICERHIASLERLIKKDYWGIDYRNYLWRCESETAFSINARNRFKQEAENENQDL